jgi:acyl-CoA thioesterase-1
MGKGTWGRPALVAAMGVLGVLGGAGCRENGSASPPSETRAGGGAVATGGAAAAASSVAASPKAEPAEARARVVLLGTSLTAGLGLDPAEAYPALLQQRADSAGYRVEVVNAGLSGETSAGALRRARWVLEQPAALVVLEVGANDGLRGVDPDSTYANLVALVGVVRAAQPAARVVLVQMEAPTNLGARYTAGFHAAYARASRATGVPLWPFLLEGVAGDPRYNQADGIHPNQAGSVRVAATVWRSLGPVLADLFGGPGTR